MRIRLVRKSLETPSITNKDDTRMIRYAYGGYDGFVKKYGSELDYSFTDSTLHIGSGRIVFQGWEVDIDESGLDVDLNFFSTTSYYTVYLEINLVTELAEVKSLYSVTEYPEIDSGDDLTQAPSGIARFILYQVKVEEGNPTKVIKVVPPIPYGKDEISDLKQKIEDTKTSISNGLLPAKVAKYASEDESKGTIEERLTKLGFKSGQATPSSAVSLTQNEIKKLGTMVYGRYIQPFDRNAAYAIGDTVFTVPEDFRPYIDTEVYGYGVLFNGIDPVAIKLTIKTNGMAIISGLESSVPVTYAASFNIVYGYMTVDPAIYM